MLKPSSLVVAFICSVAAVPALGSPYALYDPITGNVAFVVAPAGQYLGIELEADDQYLVRTAASKLGGAAQFVDTEVSGQLQWANFSGFPAGRFDAGNIIVPHTPLQALNVTLYTIRGSREPASIIFDLMIPEPSSALLSAIAIGGLLSHRRCHRI